MIEKPHYFETSFLVLLIITSLFIGLGSGLYFLSTLYPVCQITEENFIPSAKWQTVEQENQECLNSFKQFQFNILIGFPLMGITLGIFKSILDYKFAVNAWIWARQQNWKCHFCSSTLTEDNLCSYGKEKIVFCETCGKKQYGEQMK